HAEWPTASRGAGQDHGGAGQNRHPGGNRCGGRADRLLPLQRQVRLGAGEQPAHQRGHQHQQHGVPRAGGFCGGHLSLQLHSDRRKPGGGSGVDGKRGAVEAGLPPNVIQFVPADGPVFGDAVTSNQHFCGLNFTGSVPTFKRLWKQVAENLDCYRNFPRLAGECGGKNFHLVHSSADVSSVVNGTLRSAFEYGGQKCSACSRLYAPDSLWPQIKEKLLEETKKIKVGDPAQDFGTFFSAVIDDKSFARIKKWIEHAKKSPNLTILAGGGCDDSVGYFIEPCIVESKDPKDPIMKEEIFGPILTVYVYPEKQYKDVLELIDTTTPYGLTGAVFAQEKSIIEEARSCLRNTAGNFYINDKSTGAVVAQQPFGGSRISGTNDKPGGPHYILRWTSPQAIKETHVPLRDWRYAYMH
uniref:L-glutamate gamma-semialdehyde dehydrogenase n=1 Tax=Anser cygnoides TaxID=8845 RepID=A0A8B9ERW2_ANSCY